MDYHFSYREKNGSVCLILSYKVGSRWRQKTRQGFKTQREARQHQDELLEQVRTQAGLTDDKMLKDISLKDFFPLFARDRKNTLSYNTLRNYRDGINSLGSLADVPIRDLTHADLVNAILGTDAKPSTKKARLRFITPVLEHARTMYQIIADNPANGITIPRDKAPRKIRSFTRVELAALLTMLKPWPVRYLMTLMAANTGMRFGEVAGLTWDAIDWHKRTITIRQQFAQKAPGEWGLTTCKTATSNRTIPASATILSALETWRHKTPLNIQGTIFPLSEVNTAHHMVNTLIRQKFPGRSFHSLRHTFATLLLSETGDINLVAHVIGDSVATVSAVYVDYTDDINRIAEKAIGNLY